MEQKNLHAWLETPLGQYVLQMEQDMLDQAVANLFGFNALQISWPHLDGLRTNRIPHHMTLSPYPGGTIQAEPCALPIASQSLDLVVMPHALEFTEHPHALLREVDRVMRPEGRLVIVGFNPRSLWGVRQLFTLNRRVSPWSGHFISLSRLKDWLALLSFDMDGGRFGAYAPPFTSAHWLHRFRFMELAGDRWWGVGGGIYLLQAVKRVHAMRLITPRWQPQNRVEPSLAAAVRSGGVRRQGTQPSAKDNVVPLLPRPKAVPVSPQS